MKLYELLERSDFPKYSCGLCDDIFLVFMEFHFRWLKHGYNEIDENAVQFMEVDFKDEICAGLFLCFCYYVGNLHDENFIKILINSQYDYIVTKQNLSENELVRLGVLKELIGVSLKNGIRKTIDDVSHLSVSMCSPSVYNYCLELCERSKANAEGS